MNSFKRRKNRGNSIKEAFEGITTKASLGSRLFRKRKNHNQMFVLLEVI